jgi:general secretion pathway protein G
VVMTAVALLLSVIAPVYVRHIDRAREVALRQDLRAVRDALDKFFADQGRYPAGLHELVATKYLRALPMDPMTERTDTWVLVPASEGGAGIRDLRSGASGRAQDGSLYAQW